MPHICLNLFSSSAYHSLQSRAADDVNNTINNLNDLIKQILYDLCSSLQKSTGFLLLITVSRTTYDFKREIAISITNYLVTKFIYMYI